jgi:hypothetical protein
MRKIALRDWPALLERQLAALRPAVAVALEVGGAAAAELARAKIGTYQPGWAALAVTTVAEKTALGYAPPDNPRLRTGEDRDSIGHDVEGLRLRVGSESPITRWQELGTDKVPPRPVIGPALLESLPAIGKGVAAAVGKILSGTRV